MFRTVVCRSLLILACLGLACSAAEAGKWHLRLYGYQPINYGYPPSNYVFPRYGFQRGYVYFERPPYGTPLLDDPKHCPPDHIVAAPYAPASNGEVPPPGADPASLNPNDAPPAAEPPTPEPPTAR